MIVEFGLFGFFACAAVLLYGSMRATRCLKAISSFAWITAGLTTFSVSVLLVQQAFGFAGVLNSEFRYAVLLLTGLALVWFGTTVGSARPRDAVLRHAAEPSNLAPTKMPRVGIVGQWTGWYLAILVATATACFLFHGLRSAIWAPPTDGDAIGYHLPISVCMLQDASVNHVDAPFGYYPSHSELWTHWLIQPLRCDLLAGFQNVIPALLLSCSMAGLFFSATRKVSLSLALTLGFLLSLSPVRAQLFSQGNDLFLTAFWLAAIQMLLAWRETGSLLPLVLSAAAIGVVLGTKYSGVYYFGVYCALWGLCAWLDACRYDRSTPDAPAMKTPPALVKNGLGRPLRLGREIAPGIVAFRSPKAATFAERKATVIDRRILSQFILVLLIASLVGGGWYVRNWWISGSPVYPADLGIFEVDATGIALRQRPGDRNAIADHLNSLQTYKLLLAAVWQHAGVVGIATIVMLPFLLIASPRVGPAPRWFWITVIALTLIAPVISPMSAENSPGTLDQLRSGYTPVRYALPFFAVAFALMGGVFRELGERQGRYPIDMLLAACMLGPTLAAQFWGFGGGSFIALALILAIAAFCRTVGIRSLRWIDDHFGPRYALPSLVLAGVGLAILIAWLGPAIQAARVEARCQAYADFHYKAMHRDTRLFHWFDEHIHHSLVDVYGAKLYPFFGPDLSNHARHIDGFERMHDLGTYSNLEHRYIVVGRTFDDGFEGFGQFPEWKRPLDSQPDQFPLVFQDEFASVFEILH